MRPDQSTIVANKYAFLNGTEGLHETDQELFDEWTKEGKECIVVDRLFDFPERLKLAVGCECWVMYTTGLNPTGLMELFEKFKKLKFIPNDVVFLLSSEDEFIGMAREFEGKIRFHGSFPGFGDSSTTTYLIPYLNS